MSDLNRSIRLAAYAATAGTMSAVEADIQVYDGPPIDLAGGAQLSLDGLNFQFNIGHDYRQYFESYGWSFCCGYAGKYYSYCTNWGGSWVSTYWGYVDLEVGCNIDLNGAAFKQIGEVVDGRLDCGISRTSLCSFTYLTYSNCGDIDYQQYTNCNDTRRFHVGFSVLEDGTEIFGWIELEGTRNDMAITRWAYEDSGAPLLVGQMPEEPCEGNLNGDGTVDAADLGLLLSQWGSCDDPTAPCAADLNLDWSIDAADLGLLLSLWGDCPDPCAGIDCADADECTVDACIEGVCYNVESQYTDACWPGECCSANGSPGCESSVCEEIVCAVIPYCCETDWDQNCAVFAPILGCECP